MKHTKILPRKDAKLIFGILKKMDKMESNRVIYFSFTSNKHLVVVDRYGDGSIIVKVGFEEFAYNNANDFAFHCIPVKL